MPSSAANVQPARMSLRAFGRRVNVKLASVQRAIRAGRLHKSVGHDAKGSFIADSALAKLEWSQKRAKPANGGGRLAHQVVAEGSTLVEAQRRVAAERATALELANRHRRGELVDAAAVEREQFEIARIVRDGVLNVPDRLAAELAGETEAARVHARLSAELRRALSAIAELLERG